MTSKVWLIVATWLIGIALVLPSFIPEDSTLARYLPDSKLNLGLDLQGGLHVVLGVDVEKTLQLELENLVDDFSEELEKDEIRLTDRKFDPATNQYLVSLRQAEQVDRAREILRANFLRRLEIEGFEGKTSFRLALNEDFRAETIQLSLEQARQILQNRIDEFGVSEPIIQLEGDDRILIQLPGAKNPEEALALIGRTALLEFRMVSKEDRDGQRVAEFMDLVDEARKEIEFPLDFTPTQLANLNEKIDSKLPEGTFLSFEKERGAGNEITSIRPILVEDEVAIAGQNLEGANVYVNSQTNQPEVGIDLNKKGAEALERMSTERQNERMAVMLDNEVVSDPFLSRRISAVGGSASIRLGRMPPKQKQEYANFLALVLRSGALPAPVEVLENRSVGASLGEDSIRKGELSGALAALVVLLFMLVYYRASGLVANIAVLINLTILMAVMTLFGATLTLPGIAGIVLTIGMAVDANVIVLERIREELLTGQKKVQAAIDSGYELAKEAILPANLTTVIAALVLLKFGSGPIRGFAVTLLIGVVCSYITAVYFTRWIYDWIYSRYNFKKLSI